MKKMILKLKNYRGLAQQYRRRKPSGSGFVILFAVTLSAILMALALSVASIALEEVKFSTSAEDTNNAFLSADTGTECALYNDRSSSASFKSSGGSGTVTCLNETIPLTGSYPSWSFVLSGLGGNGMGCAVVSLTRDASNPPAIKTSIISDGYNVGDSSCVSSDPNRVQRELQTSY